MSDRSPSDTEEQYPPFGKTQRNRRTLVRRVVLLGLLSVTIAVAVVVYLAQSEPAYWKAHRQFLEKSSPQQLAELASQVDRQIEALANFGLEPAAQAGDQPADLFDEPIDGDTTPAARPEDVRINVEQTLTLNNEQLAAVVQTRMDDWLLERGYLMPEEIKDPMIRVEDGELVMAFLIRSGPFSAVISGRFTLNILDNGMAELMLNRFLVGQLPVPADTLSDHLHKISDGDNRVAEAGYWLGKLQYLQLKPVLELEHRRRARVMDYKVFDDGLELTVRIQDHLTYKAMNHALAGVPTN